MITRESQSSASQSNENMKRVHKLAFPNRLFTVLSLKSLVQDQQVYLWYQKMIWECGKFVLELFHIRCWCNTTFLSVIICFSLYAEYGKTRDSAR